MTTPQISIWPESDHVYPDMLDSKQPQSQSQSAGFLSLHNYRKYLSDSDDYDCITSKGGKKLKRKNGAVNLQQTPTRPVGMYGAGAMSVSSATSSPPPLSPSYSMSLASQRSEVELEGLEKLLLSSSPEENTECQSQIRATSNSERINTFRGRLNQTSPTYSEPSSTHTKSTSDSILDLKQSKTTMVHGAMFEILNPRDSLKLARIVSYIEDMDSFESLSNRDSLSGTTISTAEPDSPVLLLDGLVPHPEEKEKKADSESTTEQKEAHLDLIGDLPYNSIPTITERLSQPNSPYYANFHPTPPLDFDFNDTSSSASASSLGEPGPGYAIHEHDDEATRQLAHNLAYLGIADFWNYNDDNNSPPAYQQHQYPNTAQLPFSRIRPVRHVSPSAQRKIQKDSCPLRRLRGLARTLVKGRFCFRRGRGVDM